jgi:hypothetical protein
MLLSILGEAHAQPHPIARGEDNVRVEIRYYAPAALSASKLRAIPSAPTDMPQYSVWPMNALAFHHEEPCWKSASPCEIARITVRTLYRLPVLGTWVNWTRWWCTPNSSGQCELPAFDPVAVPPGQSLCATYDRVRAQWKRAPHVCDEQDTGLPREVKMTPTGVSAPHGHASLTDAQGVVWWLGQLDPACEGGVKRTIKRNTVAVGTADELRICSGVVYARDGDVWYRTSPQVACDGAGWIRFGTVPPC